MKAVQFTEYGGPDVLKMVELGKPKPAPNEVLIEIHLVGVNYADTARREGKYVVPTMLPFIPGAEIGGVVVEVGEEVTNVKIGERVVTLIESGGYAEYAVADERSVIPLKEEQDLKEAVSLPLQGLSAYHILKTMGSLREGETVLVHAAAGGVGTLAVQLAKLMGAGKVIATASTEEKLELARSLGADVCINYTKEGWYKEVLEATNYRGVNVALEMAGGNVFKDTLKCLATFGRLVIYGVASGEQAIMYPSSLMARNQSVIGFFLPQIMRKPDLLLPSIRELFSLLEEGKLKIMVGEVHPLDEAANVHELLQSRKTTGKVLLEVRR